MDDRDRALLIASWPAWLRDVYEERAAIREHDGGQTRENAERWAFLETVERQLSTRA